MAALTVDAHDFTGPVESAVSSALPVMVLFIAGIFAVALPVRWIVRIVQYETREREYEEYERGERDSVG